MNGPYKDLSDELSRWDSAGLKARFWWRDDDACSLTPELEQLENMAKQFDIQIGLSIIPAKLQPDLVDFLQGDQKCFLPMCHGWRHENYGSDIAPDEFGTARPFDEVYADACAAFETFTGALGGKEVFFVPPYGNISPQIARKLGDIGFAALSNSPSLNIQRLTKLHARLALLPTNPLTLLPSIPGDKTELHAHIDPIDWRRKTAFDADTISTQLVGELRLRRKRYISPFMPIGIMTHHLVHDDAVWRAVNDLLEHLTKSPAATFPPLLQLMRERSAKGNLSAPIPSISSQTERSTGSGKVP